jgi:hypothetical protein
MSCETSTLFILGNFVENSFIYVFGFLSGALGMMAYTDHRKRLTFWQLMSNLMDIEYDHNILMGISNTLNAYGNQLFSGTVNHNTVPEVLTTDIAGMFQELARRQEKN